MYESFYRAEPPKQGEEIPAETWDMAERLIRAGHRISKIALVSSLRQVDKKTSLIVLKKFVEWKAAQISGFYLV